MWTITPNDGKFDKTLIFLHSSSGSSQKLLNYYKLGAFFWETPNLKLVFPQSSIKQKTITPWFKMDTSKQRDDDGRYDFDDIEASAETIVSIIEHEKQFVKDSKQIFIGGRS